MERKTPAKPLSRKTYFAPRLTRYGDVRKLVNSGTGALTETMTTGQDMRMPSCRSLKENIVRIGRHPSGIGLYLFDYRPALRDAFGHGRQFGVMVDEVEAVMPRAVSMGPHGHKVVDYAMLAIRRSAC